MEKSKGQATEAITEASVKCSGTVMKIKRKQKRADANQKYFNVTLGQ